MLGEKYREDGTDNEGTKDGDIVLSRPSEIGDSLL